MSDELGELIKRQRFPGDSSWVMPAYDGWSNINAVNSVLEGFHVAHGTPLAFHEIFLGALRGARKILLLVCDGMGWYNLQRAHGQRMQIRELMSSATCWPLTSAFPSTTSAVMCSLTTGVPPAVHGVIGYLMYFPEYRHVFNMLNFTTPDARHEDLLDYGFVPERYPAQPTIFQRLAAQGLLVGAYTNQSYITSGLSRMIYAQTPHPYYALGDLLAQAMDQLRAPLPQFQFLYWSTLDTLAHNYGAGSEAYAGELAMLLTTIHDQLLPHLDHETALLITADHGHIDGNDADALNLMDLPDVVAALRAPPAGEGRAMHLFIHPGQIQTVRQRLLEIGRLTILTKEEFLALCLLGNPPLHAGLEARIGDLLVLPHEASRVLYEYQPRPHTTMMGRHGGLSPEEMIVPLLVFTR